MAFTNRTDGGEQLADRLIELGTEADLVCAIPRGGLPVGRAVADRLEVPLDVVVASKIGAPANPELAIGAVAGDGSYWLNDELVSQLGVSDEHIQRERETEAEAARQKVADYRGGEPLPDVAGERVVLVDDGIATGATAMACLRQLQATEAEEVILAVPVAPPSARNELADEADRVVIVDEPRPFQAVGRHYREFGQVTDEEAIELLQAD